jgi:hypothetical protein
MLFKPSKMSQHFALKEGRTFNGFMILPIQRRDRNRTIIVVRILLSPIFLEIHAKFGVEEVEGGESVERGGALEGEGGDQRSY